MFLREIVSEEAENNKKKGKQARVWDLAGKHKDAVLLDYSAEPAKSVLDGDINENGEKISNVDGHNFYEQNVRMNKNELFKMLIFR